MALDLVQGWTGPIDYQLKIAGATFDASGMNVTMEARGLDGALVDVSGDVDWLDPLVSTVRYTPDADDLAETKSTYSVRFKVTSTAGKVTYFPNAEGERWTVRT